MKFVIVTIVVLLTHSYVLIAQCTEQLVLSGEENIVRYGMDTTKNWWAVTEPFSQRYRLTVSGKPTQVFSQITPPVFSPDGEKWAAFAFENGRYFLLRKDTAEMLNCTEVQQIIFSSDSRIMGIALRQETEDVIRFGEREIRVLNRVGQVYISPGGERVAYMIDRAGQKALFIDSREIVQMDEIRPLGFWNDGEFVYAARSGKQWNVFKNKKELTGMISEVGEAAVNQAGSTAAALVRLFNGRWQLMLFSDEYYEPIKGREYEKVSGLILHPHHALAAFKAVLNANPVIVQNTTEYSGGTITGPPQYSSDGKDIFFVGEDTESFVNMNGRRYSLKNQLSANGSYAFAPGRRTIAYSSNSTLIVQDFEKGTMRAGFMTDELIAPRHNRLLKKYETLGRINQRLYLLSCPD
ncbi:MAG TPA: hypothetical protein VEC36_05010 [Patescibacteria group bacterium]|nr:hypothetical protein [Patescibacteria group bacterium]